MLSNKDINFDDARQILTINGEPHAVGDPAIPGEIDALDERVTALEEGGGGVTVIDFNFTNDPFKLMGFDKTRLIIGKNEFSGVDSCTIIVLRGETQAIMQDFNRGFSIIKDSDGWRFQKMSGSAGKCYIFEL